MVIAHNLLALNGKRMNGITEKKIAKTTKKLSSGYKINMASDDAAGLAISEEMRKQIRGLRRGTDNIEDGISLVQTAEGALGEVTEILQRVNELSIQAYNGTNSRNDKEICQEEIDELFKEITRIADSTTFNELHVLKGNPTQRVLHTSVVQQAQEVTETVTHLYRNCVKEIPSWLYVDENFEIHYDYGVYDQDTSGVMWWDDLSDGKKHYRGPAGAMGPDCVWEGGWTNELDNNSTAKIDYSGLANSATVEELYKNLFDLVGSSIGIPCGTCANQYFGINYTGSLPGYKVGQFTYYANSGGRMPGATLNLTSWRGVEDSEGNDCTCFELVDDLMKQELRNPDMTQEQKERAVKDAAAKIAKALCEESYNRMMSDPSNIDHYDKAIKVGDYSIIVYDYRDNTIPGDTDASVQTSAYVDIEVEGEETHMLPEIVERKWVDEKTKLYVQCSSDENDKIPLDLPEISLKKLGLLGYDIAKYVNYYGYSNSYKQRLQEWENSGKYVEKYVTKNVTVSEQIVPPIYEPPVWGQDLNGEPVLLREGRLLQQPVYESHEEERTVLVLEMEYPYPRPVPGASDIISREAYEPSDVQIISDALAYVSRARANLGALQNRMEHAYRNNGNKHENTTASESAIRDTDMAKSMMEFSKDNILKQAGESLMAQANQSNQGVLQLLG